MSNKLEDSVKELIQSFIDQGYTEEQATETIKKMFGLVKQMTKNPWYEQLTTRGWVVLIGFGVAIIFGLMMWWGDRMVICDWRGGYEPCRIERFADVVRGWK